MQILHVTQGYAPALGGTEYLIQRISEEMVQQFGDEVTVFTTNCYSGEAFFKPNLPRMPVGCETINGVCVRRFPVRSRISQRLRWPQAVAYRLRLPFNEQLRTWSGGPIIPELRAAIRVRPADVIVASSFPLMHMLDALRAARDSRRPCVFLGGLHPDDPWGFQRSWIYNTIPLAQRYVAYTKYEANYVRERCNPSAQITVIGLGVDAEKFVAVRGPEAKERLGVGEAPVVGFIGQLGVHKGVDTLLQAMPLVWAAVPEARLLIAGARTMFVNQIEMLMREWSAEQRTRTLLRYNFLEVEKPDLFGACDVFAYPSGYESFGISFVEAWAAGKPVIGCRRGAVPDVVQSGRDGLLVDYQNVEQLAAAIILLLKNRGWAQQLGETGRQKTLRQHTWPVVARRFRAVYADALAASSPSQGTI